MAVDTGHTQGSGTKTLAAQNQDDGTEALDQAQPHERRVHVAEKAERKEVQGCTPRKDLKRIAAVGSVETAQARTDHRRHKTASFCALTDTAMWVELDYQAETLEAAICGAIVTNLGCGMHPREILDQLIARRLIRDPGNNALEDVVQRLADIAEHMKRDW